MLNTSLRLDPIKTSPTKTSGLKLDPIKLDPPLTYKDSTFHKGVNALRETVMGPVESVEGLTSGLAGYGVGATKAGANAIFDYLGVPNPIPALRSSKPYMEQIEEVASKFATQPTTRTAKSFLTPADVSPDDPTITAALKRAVNPMNIMTDIPVAAGEAGSGVAKGLGAGEPVQFLSRLAGEFAGGAKVFKKGGELKSIARDALLKDKPKPPSPVELRLDSKELDRMAVEPIEPVEPTVKRFISEEQVPKAEVKPKEHTIFDEEYESLELPGEEISTILDKTNSEGIAKELNLKYNGAMGKGDKEIFMFTEPDYGATFSVKVGDDVAMKLQSKVAEFEKAGNEKIIPESSKIEQKAGEVIPVEGTELHTTLQKALKKSTVIPEKDAIAIKAKTKETLEEKRVAGEIEEGSPVRFTSVDEIRSIVKNGKLSIGEDFEGRPSISASELLKDVPTVAYGPNNKISAAIVFPKGAIEGRGVQPNEVMIKPGTDVNGLRFIVDGHKNLLTLAELKKVYGKEKKSIAEEKYDASTVLYSGIDPTKIVDLGKRAAGLTKEAVEILKEKSPVIKSASDMAHVGMRELKHLLYDPQSVLHKDPNASKSFWRFVDAEEGSNRFIDPHFTKYTKATKGIKKGSDSDARVADALDGVISPDTLTTKERTAYNFFKTNYDFLIHKAARTFAGSEGAYQRVLHYVSNKMPKRSKIADLDEARLQEYNTLAAQAKEIRGNRKVNELKGDDLLEYRDKRQEMIDFLNKDFIDRLPEGEREAYTILSRRIEQYFPHMFEPKELIKIFELDIKELKDNLAKIDIQVRATMGKTVLTRSEKRLLTRAKTYTEKLQKLESAVVNLKGGKYISFRNLPGEISFRFFNPRTGKKGYGRSALKSYETYLFGLARKMYDEPARKQVVKEWFNDVDPELKPYLQAFMDRYMGHDTSPLNKIANAITTFEWIRTLGFNPRSALVNLSQNVNTLAYVGEKYVVEAGKMLLTDHARAKELFAETGIAREVPNVLTEGGKSAGLEVLNNAARFMFNNVELGNRKIAFIAGYLKGKDAGIKRGLTKEALEAFAKKKGMETVHETQFRYGKLGMPKIFWHPAGRVAFQFSSYPLKQIRFLYRLMKNDPVALIKYIGYTTGINYTLQEFLDTDLSNALGVGITWGELFSAIKSAGEGDTKGALRHLKQTVELGSGLLPSGPGPVASGLLSVAEAAGQGKGMQQLGKELEPIMAARLREAYTAVRDSSDGEYPVKDTKGHLKYRLTGKQLLQRTIGPKTAEEKRVSLNYGKARNLELERREVLNEMTVAIIEGDDDTLIDLATKYKIVPTDEQIMNELKRRNMTLEEMGRSRKQMEYQLDREGEIY